MLPFGSPEENVREARERHLRRYLEAQRNRQKAKVKIEAEEQNPIRLSRFRRRIYIVAAVIAMSIAELSLWKALPEAASARSDVETKRYLLFWFFVIGAHWLFERVQESTAWPRRPRSDLGRRQSIAWTSIRLKGQRYGYLFACKVGVFAFLYLFIRAFALETGEGPKLSLSSKPALFITLTVVVILIAIPTAYVGWFGPDERPINECPTVTRLESV
jgi:hypothetical protein